MNTNDQYFHILVATDLTGGIGFQNRLPWRNTTDLQNFRRMTRSHRIIMGHNTFKSLNRPAGLLERQNVVLSHTATSSIYDQLQYITDVSELPKSDRLNIVIGGEQIYRHFLENHTVQFIIRCVIHGNYQCDAHFPEVSTDIFDKVLTTPVIVTMDGNIHYEIYSNRHRHLTTKDIIFYNDIISILNITTTYNPFHYTPSPSEMETIAGETGYLCLAKHIIRNGELRETRNGYTRSIFGHHLRFNCATFPLLTTKKMALRAIFEELSMFLNGQTDSKILEAKNINIWKYNTSREFLDSNENTAKYQEGYMGPMYGFQWLYYGADYTTTGANMSGFNQLQYVIDELTKNPTSRRILMTTFHPVQAQESVLYPCHGIVVQFYVSGERILSCAMYQRSADVFLGLPFNIASYSILLYMIADVVNMTPGELHIFLGDTHIYETHMCQMIAQITRIPYDPPRLHFTKKLCSLTDMQTMTYKDIVLTNYQSHEQLTAKML